MELIVEIATWTTSGIVGLAGVVFGLRKLIHLKWPIRVDAGYTVTFEEDGEDTINAVIVNESREAQYVVRCVAVGIRSYKSIAAQYIRRPFLRRRWWRVARYDVIVHDFAVNKWIKLEPFEEVKLNKPAFSSPLSLYLTRDLVIQVTLSTQRVFNSKPLPVPKDWRERTIKTAEARMAVKNRG